jgi:hypothetical protein
MDGHRRRQAQGARRDISQVSAETNRTLTCDHKPNTKTKFIPL